MKTLWKIIPPFFAAVAFLVMSTLYCLNLITPYRLILNAWGVDWGVAHFSPPFLDTDTILSAVRCMNRGVDVYVSNPCDVLGRVYDYSPLWMVLVVFPATGEWRMPIGLCIDLAYVVSLLLLPVARSKRGAILIAAGVLSSASVFAVERGNSDLVLFVLVAGCATLLCRSALLRAIGYGCALLAGLLKYYPLALMLMATREQVRAMLTVWLFAAATVILFVAVTWHDLIRALTLIPQGSYFEDMFGAINVGGGLTKLLGLPPIAGGIIKDVMTIGALALGFMLGRQQSSHTAMALLGENEKSFLLAGAIMLAGCFFTAQNIGYRAVHILLVLPALVALACDSRLRRFRYTMPIALVLLWSQGWRDIVHQVALHGIGKRADYIGKIITWGIREAMWWFLITILVSCAVTLVLQSASATALLARCKIRSGEEPTNRETLSRKANLRPPCHSGS
jgi:hypothetical protein